MLVAVVLVLDTTITMVVEPVALEAGVLVAQVHLWVVLLERQTVVGAVEVQTAAGLVVTAVQA
jgi:hypothetical protein